CGAPAQHRDRLQYGNSCPQQSRELLIEKEKIVGLDAPTSSSAAASRHREDAFSFGWCDREDLKALALKPRAGFVRRHRFDGTRYNLARRRSQSNSKFSHLPGRSISRGDKRD